MKTIQDLTEQQWAKIHGHRAGVSNYLSNKNPYILGFNDMDGSLAKIWEQARKEARFNNFLGYKND